MALHSGGFVEQAPLFQGYWCVHRTGSSGIPGLFNRSERSDKMTKNIKLVAAIVMAFAAQSAMADLDFGGYLRSGSGSSSKGGGTNCFKLNQGSVFNTAGNSDSVDHAGRLGNQCDTYGEIKLGANMGDSDGTKFGVHTLVAYGTGQVADYEGTIPALREAYGSATGFGSGALAQATAWAGKRYYKREDVHIVDLFIMQDTGPGAGIENIDVGFGKFSYAWMRAGNANYDSSAGGQEIGRVTTNGDPSQQKSDHDLRLEGINLGSAGSLGFGTNIVRSDNAAVSGNDFNGYSLWAKHSKVLFGTWQNALWLQSAHGAGQLDGSALYWAQSTSGNGSPNSMHHSAWRIIDAANFDISDKWNGAAFLGYGKESFPWYGIGTLPNGTRTSWSMVVRPIYHFTENLGLAVEAGTTRVSGNNLNYDGNPNSTTDYLNKITISPQLSMGSGFYARPVLRAYVSYMSWNRDSTAYGTETGASACTGRDCSVGVPGIFDNVSSAITYGVQMEAWW
jgi:maltoporin